MGNTSSSSVDADQLYAKKGTAGTRREKSRVAVGGQHDKVLDDLLDDLLQGERSFTTNMQTLVDVFYSPLVRWLRESTDAVVRTGTSTCPVSRADVEAVFGNVDELISFSRRLVLALEQVRTAKSKVTLVVFLQLATSFKVYDMFVASSEQGLDCLAHIETNPRVAMFIKACEFQERCGGLRLRDFLAMPLQRVAKYRRLVDATAGNCPPCLVTLQRELAQSLTPNPSVVDEVVPPKNDTMDMCTAKEAVEAPQCLLLNGTQTTSPLLTRHKIKEGHLAKVCDDGPRLMHFALFSDELVVRPSLGTAAADTRLTAHDLKHHHHHHHGNGILTSVPLSRCYVVDGFESPLHASFVVASAENSFLVQATNEAEKKEWIASLTASMDGATSVECSKSGAPTTFLPRSTGGEQLVRGSGKCTTSSTTTTSTSVADIVALISDKTWIGTGNDSSSTTTSDAPEKDDISKKGQSSSPSRSSATSMNWRRDRSKGAGGKGAWKRTGAGGGGGLVDPKRDVGATEQAHTDGVSSSSGNVQSREGEKDERDERPEECSFWVACGADGKVLRWETLRLDVAPSNDDIWNGSVGFCRALADPTCHAEFRELLRERHASENLNFRGAVSHYQALCCSEGTGLDSENTSGDRKRNEYRKAGSSAAAAAEAAREIVDRFIKEGAPEQVNLSATAREAIMSRPMEEEISRAECPPSVDLFSNAWTEVSKLLQRGAFMHFRHSEAFRRLRAEWTGKLSRVLSASDFMLTSSDDGFIRASHALATLVLHPPAAPDIPSPPRDLTSETSFSSSPFSPTTVTTARTSSKSTSSTSSSSSPQTTATEAGITGTHAITDRKQLEQSSPPPSLPPPPPPPPVTPVSTTMTPPGKRSLRAFPHTTTIDDIKTALESAATLATFAPPTKSRPFPTSSFSTGTTRCPVIRFPALFLQDMEYEPLERYKREYIQTQPLVRLSGKTTIEAGRARVIAERRVCSVANWGSTAPRMSVGASAAPAASAPAPFADGHLSSMHPTSDNDLSMRRASKPCPMPPLPLPPSTPQAADLVSTPVEVSTVPKKSSGQAIDSVDKISHSAKAGGLLGARARAGARAEAGADGKAVTQQDRQGTSVSIEIPASSGFGASDLTALTVSASGGQTEQPLPPPAESPFVPPPPAPPRLSTARHCSSSRIVDGATTRSAEACTGKKNASTNFPSVTSRERRTCEDRGGKRASKVSKDSRNSASSKKKGANLERDKAAAEKAPRSGSAGELRKGNVGLQASGDRSSGEERLAAATGEVKTTPRHTRVRLLLRTSPGKGLGFMLVNERGMAKVCGVGSPSGDNPISNSAKASGLRAGDVLLSVNGLHVRGNFQQAVELTRVGLAGGELSLVVKRLHISSDSHRVTASAAGRTRDHGHASEKHTDC